MHSYLKDLAFAGIGLGAVFCVPALLMPARVRDRREQRRHSRGQVPARPRGEGWPDLRTCLTVMAIGASLLADQSADDRARLLLAIPVFAVLIWNVVSWLASRARRRSGGQRPGGAGYETARHRGDPGYSAGSRYPADLPYRHAPSSPARRRNPAPPGPGGVPDS
jgi:hypothetical protein